MVPHACLVILAAWIGLGLTFAGVGRLGLRLIGAAAEGADGWLLAFWVGWVGALFALQIWHLLLPVDVRALAALALAGAIGLVAGRLPRPRSRGASRALPLLALAVTAAWLSNRALGGPQHGDSGAYFIPTVRWLVAYPIVPGLANLFVPYGFNQSYFLYVAMLEVGPFTRGSYHVANGVLVLALFARGYLGLYRVLRPKRRSGPADVFHALFLPVVVALAVGIFLTSPSPDLPVFVLGVVVSGELIAFLARGVPRLAPDRNLLVIVLLAAGGITVKLSFAGLGAAIMLVAALVFLVRDRPGLALSVRTGGAIAVIFMVSIVPWVVRNVFLSGRPFYPSPVGALPVEWRTRADAVEWIAAPMHFGASPWEALGEPRWLLTRLDSLGWLSSDVVLPMAIALAGLAVAAAGLVLRLLRRRPRASGRPSAVILVPPLASLVFVAANAPMAHYTGATFWLLALQAVLLVVGSTGTRLRLALGAGVLVAVCVVLVRERPLLRDLREFEPAPTARVAETRLESGLIVRVPEYGQCWDAALPCSPNPPPDLRLRRPGDLESGFMVEPGGP